jgi:hypothetical protein
MLYLAEQFVVGDVVDDDDAGRAAVLRPRDRVEMLPAGCVPDLGLDRLFLDFDFADRRDVVVAEHVLGKPEKKA